VNYGIAIGLKVTIKNYKLLYGSLNKRELQQSIVENVPLYTLIKKILNTSKTFDSTKSQNSPVKFNNLKGFNL